MSEAPSSSQPSSGPASLRQGWPWLFKLGVLLLLGLAVLWFLRKIYHTAIVFFFAYLIAALLNPVVLRLTRRNVPRVAAIIAVYSVLLLVACALILLAVPSLMNQVQALLNLLPSYLAKAQDLFVQFQVRYESLQLPPNVREAIQTHGTQFLEKIGALAGRGVQQLGNVLLGLISWFFIFLAALAVSLFLLLNMGSMEAQFYRLLPERYRA
ncbi:MAG: AI-2E family transporter, partial [Armatimonadetes bacterium]|nr:AI-2E family transporter [Armatimonadota bacterium]